VQIAGKMKRIRTKPKNWHNRSNSNKNNQNGNNNGKDGKKDENPNREKYCYFCKIKGHLKKECRKWAAEKAAKAEKANASKESETAEVVLMGICQEDLMKEETEYPVNDDFFDHFQWEGGEMEDETQEMAFSTSLAPDKFTNHTWLCDSAATSHMKHNKEGMSNLVEHVKKITVGDGKVIYSTHIGTFNGIVAQKDGSTRKIQLQDTYLVPDLWINLFSLTKAMTKGSLLSNDGHQIKVSSKNGDLQLKFDRKIDCGKRHLLQWN